MQSKSKISLTPTNTFDDGDTPPTEQPEVTTAPESTEKIDSHEGTESATKEPTLKQSLTESLASILFIDANTIGQHQSFDDLGLDSVLAVEWIREINKTYGITIEAVEIYDNSSVVKMCQLVSGKLQSIGGETGGETAEAAVPESADAPESASAEPAADAPGADIAELKQALTESLASILFIDPSQVGARQSFDDLGLDSVLAVEWVREVNKTYSIEIEATQIYDNPSIAQMSELVSQLLNGGTVAATPEPSAAQSPASEPPAAESSAAEQPATAMDLNDILAKVQSGELDIAEADKLIMQIQNNS